MYSCLEKDLILNFNSAYKELFVLESILRTIKNVCLNNDINSKFFSDSINLSNERNDYINLLSEALTKVERIRQINDNLGEKLELLQ